MPVNDKNETDEPILQPISQMAGRVVLSKSRWQFVFSQNWTAFSADLGPIGYKNYAVGSLAVHFSKPVKTGAARFYFKMDNVWGRNYQVLPFRAMPGRSGKIGARLAF